MITTSIVSIEDRVNFFQSITKQYVWFQEAIFHFCKLHCSEYRGGSWQYVELDNGGKFLYPVDCPDLMNVTNQNKLSLQLSNEATGIYITLLTYRFYAFTAWNQNDIQEMNNIALLEKKLTDFAKQHADYESIMSLLGDQ